jgi:hypothetical protein
MRQISQDVDLVKPIGECLNEAMIARFEQELGVDSKRIWFYVLLLQAAKPRCNAPPLSCIFSMAGQAMFSQEDHQFIGPSTDR